MQLPDNNTYYDITIDNKLENVVKNDAPDLAVDALMRAIGDYAFEENINRSIKRYNPEYWRPRQSGLEAAQSARKEAPARQTER